MSIAPEIAVWTTRTLGVIAICGVIVPWIPSGSWMIRVWDFPRVQLFTLAVVVAVSALALAATNIHRTESLITHGFMVATILIQSIYILPYTNAWKPSVEHTESTNLRLLISNLDVRNTDPPRTLEAIRALNADVLLLIELNEELAGNLHDLRTDYPHTIDVIRDEGLGIAIWSKYTLKHAEIKHLVSDRRASIHTDLVIDDHTRVRFIGLHPTPPALEVRHAADNDDERYDSDIRDAELVLVAKHVAELAEEPDPDPIIVAGDFNDVAWSATTRRFQKLSALKDPRVGRGLLNTYHANYPPLRYPLDHIFLSEGIRVGEFSRIRIPGSDHFGVLIDLQIQPHADPEKPDPDRDTIENGNENIRNGLEDAKVHDESARDP